MDLVKSHISGWFFLHPVSCSPLYSSIFLQLSWGFQASDCEVYIRPGEDVTTTEVSQDTAQRGHLTLSGTSLSSVVQEPSLWSQQGLIGQTENHLTSSPVWDHGHSCGGDSSGSGYGDGWRQSGSSHPRQSGQNWHPARLRGEHGRPPAGAGETTNPSQTWIAHFSLQLFNYHNLALWFICSCGKGIYY